MFVVSAFRSSTTTLGRATKIRRLQKKRKFTSQTGTQHQISPFDGYYFADTNVVVYASTGRVPKLSEFVEDPKNFFFYSDTVDKELREWDDLPPIHPKFQYVPVTDLDYRIKQAAYEELSKHLAPFDIQKFKRDLYIIFESGFMCYDVIPVNKHPVLLTNNMRLYRKFVSNKANHALLERTVEIWGMEHLIDVRVLGELGIVVPREE